MRSQLSRWRPMRKPSEGSNVEVLNPLGRVEMPRQCTGPKLDKGDVSHNLAHNIEPRWTCCSVGCPSKSRILEDLISLRTSSWTRNVAMQLGEGQCHFDWIRRISSAVSLRRAATGTHAGPVYGSPSSAISAGCSVPWCNQRQFCRSAPATRIE